jgi:hypothetical protein
MTKELTKTERKTLLYKLAVEYYNLSKYRRTRNSALSNEADEDVLFRLNLDVFFTENKIELIKSVLIENKIDLETK